MKEIKVIGPPRIEDFSEPMIKKSVLNTTLQHPLTVFPAAAGVLCALAGFLLEPTLLVVAIGGMTLSMAAWIINYFFRGDTYANKYLNKLQEALRVHKEQVIANIEQEFDQFENVEGAQDYVDQGQEQFEIAIRKFRSYQEVLACKFNQTEITYGRYYGTAEQVYLSILDNLQEIINILKSVREIDIDYIRERIRKLDALTVKEPADEKEYQTLEERVSLRKRLLSRINELLTINEEALTKIDLVTAALSEVQTRQGHATVDMETARQKLEELAKRARDYSVTT